MVGKIISAVGTLLGIIAGAVGLGEKFRTKCRKLSHLQLKRIVSSTTFLSALGSNLFLLCVAEIFHKQIVRELAASMDYMHSSLLCRFWKIALQEDPSLGVLAAHSLLVIPLFASGIVVWEEMYGTEDEKTKYIVCDLGKLVIFASYIGTLLLVASSYGCTGAEIAEYETFMPGEECFALLAVYAAIGLITEVGAGKPTVLTVGAVNASHLLSRNLQERFS